MAGSLEQFKGLVRRRKALASQRKNKFDKNTLDYNTIFPKTTYDFPELTEFELQKLKAQIRASKRIERRNHFFLLFLIVGIVLSLVIFGMN